MHIICAFSSLVIHIKNFLCHKFDSSVKFFDDDRTVGAGAHWCDSSIIDHFLEILYTDCASFPGFVCCVFCNKKLAEIHAMTISRKNSSKECIKVSSKMFFKGFQGISLLDNNKQFPITVCCITTELGSWAELRTGLS